MSIEQALLKSAEAQEKLADAMNRYASVMEQVIETGVTFVGTPAQLPDGATVASGAASSAKEPTAAEKKAAAAAKKKAEKEAADKAAADAAAASGGEEEEDPFATGDEDAGAEKTYTTAEIRDLILKVRDKGGEKANAEGAKKVLAALGVKSMSEIPEDKYAKAAELCQAALK
jgi:colicin import membrane protein